MKIEENHVVFTDLDYFKSFILFNDLAGRVVLSDAINDKSNNILIKENVPIKENHIRKLEQMEDKYKPHFRIKINDDVIKKLQITISKAIFNLLEKSNNEFIKYLYKNTNHNYRAYIRNSFRAKNLILEFYRMYSELPHLFNHFATLGLISLGITIQNPYDFRYINRNSFLSGFFCDTGLSESEDWEEDLNNSAKNKVIIEGSITFGRKLSIPQEVLEAIEHHELVIEIEDENAEAKPGLNKDALGDATADLDALPDKVKTDDQIVNSETEEDKDSTELKETLKSGDFDQGASKQLTEILKLTKYIVNVTKEISSKDNFAEELVCIIAYNSVKGLFQKSMVNSVIKCFKEYEVAAKRMMRIANLENKCVFQNSAWAYPKPAATQIVCRKRVHGCKFIYSGWDIKIVAPQHAYGRIGTTLHTGVYPKCILEQELKNLE